MSKKYGIEYPERPLMAVLSDLLGIPHFTTSNGGTVRSDFLQAVLTELKGDPARLNKDGLIKACLVAATRRPYNPAVLSAGDTVTNEALQQMVDGIAIHGVPGRLDPISVLDLVTPAIEIEIEEFDPTLIGDERDRRLAEQAVRAGQDKFRTAVLIAYRFTCAITGTDAVRALEAAHVTPYRGPATNVVPNGIALRADIHRLWDGGQLAIQESDMTVLLGPSLQISTYQSLHGMKVPNVPHLRADRPSTAALRNHREWCGL